MTHRRRSLTAVAAVLGAGVLVACTVVALDPAGNGAPGRGGPTTDARAGAATPTPTPAPAPPQAPPPADDDVTSSVGSSGSSGSTASPAAVGTCPDATVTVATADQLTAALASASPGDVIDVVAGIYEGNFVADRSGTTDAPIHLCGEDGAVLDAGGTSDGYVLHLDGVAHWRVVGLVIRNGQKGVMADGTTASVIEGLTVEDIGDEAIHLRSASSWNTVVGNTIRRTGLRREKFGEGVYIGSATSNWGEHGNGGPDRSDGNVVRDNDISDTTSEAIDVKEGTTGGLIVGNRLDGGGLVAADSLVDIKGNEWIIESNTVLGAAEEGMQTHRILDGWGLRNVFRRNTIEVSGGGLHVYVHDPKDTANIVSCDNTGEGGAAVRTNVECTR